MADAGDDDDDGAAVIGALYEAAVDPALWGPAVDRLQRHLGGDTGGLMLRHSGLSDPEILAMQGFSEEAIRLYARHFHKVDLWAGVGLRQPALRVVLGQEIVGVAAFERSEIWNDYLRPHVGAFHLIGAAFQAGDGRLALLGLHRSRGVEAFSEADRARLARVLPHLQRALQLGGRFERARSEAALTRATLDGMRNGVIVTSPEGAVLLANSAAEALAGDEGVLSLRRQGLPLAAARPEETRRLLALARDAAGGGPGGSLLLPRPGGGAPVVAMVSRLPADFVPGLAGLAAALIVLRDLGAGAGGLAATLANLYGLTPAETELARALAAGKRPGQIALERGVKITTIRSQLSALLHKTGTRRQGDLLGLLERIEATLPGAF